MEKEKVLLVIVDYKKKDSWAAEDVGEELAELVQGCRGEVEEKVFCKIDKPTAACLIGSGKVEEIAQMCAEASIDTVVFSEDLKGSQQRNLENIIKVKTIDRTQLILDIFARHATSQEGKMQVELAQLQYLLPRLVGKGIALSRLGGGIGTLGPGETKLEVDRRRIAQRISKLKKELQNVGENRALKRRKRKEKGVPMISLVGYTNAGKSTLLNILTEAGQETRDGLFTTLDPLSRKLVLPNNIKVVLSDTVGFMHKLPLHLIEAFKATLEEVVEADLLLHVLDVSHPRYRNLYDSVLEVLKELGADQKPVITVLNKIDKMEDASWLKELSRTFELPVEVSAKTGENLENCLEMIGRKLSALIVNVDMFIPINRMNLINEAHNEGQVFFVKYYNDLIHIRAALPKKLAGLLRKARVSQKRPKSKD
ncbi:MAG: GTPase HflX [Candidatus Omnitrophica bacterium]|nr:GTPase HflX [Candidatus Omnitrophota bacterium]